MTSSPPLQVVEDATLQQDSRGHLTFMAVNREIPKYLDATLWNRGFVDANGKYYELWNAQAQYYTE